MFKVTLQSLAAKKLRLVLTSIAVVLGVAFMSGTFVLTDTLGSVFDNLFADTTKGVDAVVRSRKAFDAADEQGQNTNTRPPVPGPLVDEVRKIPQVARAPGDAHRLRAGDREGRRRRTEPGADPRDAVASAERVGEHRSRHPGAATAPGHPTR